jgi:hypothetical protein
LKIAYDIPLMRPACALLQAALGCDASLAHRFPVESWLTSPTPGLKVYRISPAQLAALVVKTEEQHGQLAREG